MKSLLFALCTGPLLVAAQSVQAATLASAEPVFPQDAGPTLTLEQLRLQIQRLTPRERQQVFRDLAPVSRPGPVQRDAAQPRAPGRGAPDGQGVNRPVRRPNAGAPAQAGDLAPGRPRQPEAAQPRRPFDNAVPPVRPMPGGQAGPGQSVQRPVINRLLEIANLPPEQQAASLNLIRQRVNNQLAQIRQQRESGNLAPEQQPRLQMLQNLSQRIEELSQLPPEEMRARLNALRDSERPRPLLRGDAPNARPRPRDPLQGDQPGAGAPDRARRPFPPPENDPYGLPPQPRPPGGSSQPRPEN